MRKIPLLLTASLTLAAPGIAGQSDAVDKTTFHGNAAREGWNRAETVLTPEAVAGRAFGQIWQSPVFDFAGTAPPRLFASPLYLGSVLQRSGPLAGQSVPVAYAVASTGFAYAVLAVDRGGLSAGTILWRRQLTANPCQNGEMGSISTPVIDKAAGRIYVTSCRDDWAWDVHALDLATGDEAKGWPLEISHRTVPASVNRNGTTRFEPGQIYFQRGALNLSADGAQLYITFGPDQQGFLVSVNTRKPAIASAFSSMPRSDMQQGGMWGASGATIDAQGRIHVVTGASFASALAKRGIPGVYPESDGAWGQSILQFTDDPRTGLKLTGTYSPFNYCQTAAADIDIASGGAVAIELDPRRTATPHLLAQGAGKQGVAYLLDRSRLPGTTTHRHACSSDPASDGSLLAPHPQPELGTRGPVVVFGPYSDSIGMVNSAKSRATPARFSAVDGREFLYFAGSSKTGADFGTNVPPSLVRLAIALSPGKPAWLIRDAQEMTVTFQNPGSPVVSSNGGRNGIVWVLDVNMPRSANVFLPDAPGALLRAFDALTLKPLWSSGQALHPTGKYNEPAVVQGMVIVGTDRLQAFGLRGESARSFADYQPVKAATSAGLALFAARCASCHEQEGTGAPARTAIATMDRTRIVTALTSGKMQAMAEGLGAAEISAIAEYLKAP
ncbi:c-type cytochrome [Novosphingobium subterraneum]|uniref:c-type cytochrome n=1 Tax=Novosphingobium subterraneum TaxID=48936 RepID=UPI003D068D68